MTKEQLNKAIEEFEISMLEMTQYEKINALIDLARKRLKITEQGVNNVAELLIILEQLSADYINLTLCRLICKQLYIYD